MKSLLDSPVTARIHNAELRNPPLFEELRVRDILDDLVVTTSGEFVAAYELSGVHSQYHDDETRTRTKGSLEAVLRALPERSVRIHVRFEIRQDAGSGIDHYIRSSRSENTVLQEIDNSRCRQWRQKEAAGEFLDFRLHLIVHWNPETHRIQPGTTWDRSPRKNWTFSERRSIERTRSEHERLVNEFDSILAGIETTLGGTSMQCRRLNDQELFLLIQQSLNPIREIKNLIPPHKGRSAEALLTLGEKAERMQIVRLVHTPVDYWICTTFQRERMYRDYWMSQHHARPLLETYHQLASQYPQGLAGRPELPEEASGAVQNAWAERRKLR